MERPLLVVGAAAGVFAVALGVFALLGREFMPTLDEQNFIVNTVNEIEQSKFWKSTAIVITYDDSDGWYDHQNSPRVNGSNDPTTDQAVCTSKPVKLGSINDRCGYALSAGI